MIIDACDPIITYALNVEPPTEVRFKEEESSRQKPRLCPIKKIENHTDAAPPIPRTTMRLNHLLQKSHCLTLVACSLLNTASNRHVDSEDKAKIGNNKLGSQQLTTRYYSVSAALKKKREAQRLIFDISGQIFVLQCSMSMSGVKK